MLGRKRLWVRDLGLSRSEFSANLMLEVRENTDNVCGCEWKAETGLHTIPLDTLGVSVHKHFSS
jgi:hypothetical protein